LKNAGEKDLVLTKGCTPGTIKICFQIIDSLSEGVALELVINKEDGLQLLDAP
jgi:hypothetical protein